MLSLTTVVVTYNRKELLLENLKMQLCQTYRPNHILIVDNNSSDGTYEYLKSKGMFETGVVSYYNTGENIGGAGGFNFGIHKACEIGDDIFCLMDDDGRPADKYCFEMAMKKIPFSSREGSAPIFINSLVIQNETDITFPYNGTIKKIEEALMLAQDGFLNGYGSPFNGTFMNEALVDLIGYPRADFFIRYDEVDYYLKAKNQKAFVGVAVNSRYYHPATSNYKTKKILSYTFVDGYEAPWKEYYKMRNYTALKMSNGRSRLRLFVAYRMYLFGIDLFDVSEKQLLKRFIKKGYKDALKGRMGKTVEPGQKVL